MRWRDTDSSTITSTAALSTSTIARNSTLLGRVGCEPRRASGEGLFGLTASNSKPCLAGCFAHVGQGRRLAHKAANRSRDQPSPPVRSPHPRPSRGGWCPACRARAWARARDMNRPRGQTIFLASAITLPIAKQISRSALAPGYYKRSHANRSQTLASLGCWCDGEIRIRARARAPLR